ncbi:MAG: hypothetical protein R2813_04445 [Flavobacteriales bacterium]
MRVIVLLLTLSSLASCAQESQPNHKPAKDEECIAKSKALEKELRSLEDKLETEARFYLDIDEISSGSSWVDQEKDKQFFFRVVLRSVEESRYIHVELIEIMEEGNLQLTQREKVLPAAFNLEYFDSLPSLGKWVSDHEVEVVLGDDIHVLDLSSVVR